MQQRVAIFLAPIVASACENANEKLSTTSSAHPDCALSSRFIPLKLYFDKVLKSRKGTCRKKKNKTSLLLIICLVY